MKSKVFLTGSILFALFVFSSWTLRTLEDKDSVVMRLIMQGLSNSHYVAIDVNDEFSREAFDLYLERVDAGKRFLLQSDIEEMRKYQFQLDDESSNGSFEFFDLSVSLLDRRIDEAQEYYKEILGKPFDFTVDEQIEFDEKKYDFAQDKAELKDRWRQYLKYQTMVRIHTTLEEQEKAEASEDGSKEIKSLEEIEKNSREKVLKTYDDYFHRLGKLDRKDRQSDYINAITSTFDPHTTYFPPKDKEDFDIQMSGQLEGIGATLTEQNDYIKVTQIVPGSPSAKQGQLQAEDLILKVAQGTEEPVDIVAMRLDEAVRLIRGKKGTEVRLTVKKPSGDILVIPITRDLIKIEETYARSLIIDDDPSSQGQYGYIKLPSFYTDFSRRGGPSCSEDVAKEIEKLKGEGIQGLILDLRFNGGGSLPDVIDMAGLFVEEGPIVQVKSRRGSPYVLKDEDPRIQYDGPLVILVNSFSASASEIMAAAIQDYKRGLIIGSPSTYGKGTVQNVYNLDDFIRGQPELYPLGAIKLTTQKFYRINGGATQQKGVIPDIILPDTYSYLEMGEKENEHSMAWDEIEPVSFTPWVKTGVFYDRAIKNSLKRTKDNPVFSLINENAHLYKTRRERSLYSLNLKTYRKEQDTQQAEAEKYKDMIEEIPGFTANNPNADLDHIQSDSNKVQVNDEWLKSIKKDPYVYEAVKVLEDL